METSDKPEKNPDNFFRSLVHVARFFRSELVCQKRNVALFLLLIVAVSLVDFICPFLTQQLIDVAVPQKDLSVVLYYSGIIIASLIIASLLNLGVVRFAVVIKEKAVYGVSRRLIRHILAKDPAFFYQYQSGDIITRFTSDMNRIGDFFYDYVLFSVFYFMITVLFIVWLYYLNWILAVCICVFLVMHVVVAVIMYRPIIQNARIAQDKNSLQNDLILDILHGESDIKVYQQESAFFDRYKQKGSDVCQAQIRALWMRDASWSMLDRLSRITNVMPIIIGSVFICYQFANVTVGVMVAFIQIMYYCSRYVSYIAYTSLRGLFVIASIDRINELITAYPQKELPPVQVDQIPDSATIGFQDVTFTYPSGKKIFDRLNLTIKDGEKVAIMAPSGFGKTTFARLLLGLSDPDSGKIFFGEKEIHSIPHQFYLSYFSYVSQDSHLFRLSVRDNIEMGWHSHDDISFNAILDRLHIRDFIDALPQKADTVLNREGLTLSTGQQQRIALARALIRDPQVLVVDEFTSGLDRVTEEQILDDLLGLMKNQTIICITHSPNVANRMDRIILLHAPGDTDAGDDQGSGEPPGPVQ
ncbi:MAG: ABC transporter ATP-binding protein [Methanomicrobiales archaeon]|nr:ABC transporter ATP-binding protein [Methanomicrobiales archaeon]